jgi:hypothetical protein
MTKSLIALSFTLVCTLLTALPARSSTLPAGTPLWVRTLEPVSSSDKAGKKFTAQLDTNLIVKGKVMAPAGSIVFGRVESPRSAGQSTLSLSLTQIVVNGRPVAITTENYEESGPRSGRTTAGTASPGKAIGATVGGTAASYAIGVLGTAIGVPSAGAAIGLLWASLGAPAASSAIGTATGLIGQRKTVVAPPGTPFAFRIARPVSL